MASILDVRLIAWDRLDAAMEEMLLLTTGRARKVITSMIATTPGMGGGGGTSGAVYGAPFTVSDNGDGTARLTVTGPGASIVPSSDGTYVTFSVGSTA